MNDREIDLINQAIDEELSEPEMAEFASLIENSQEARAFHDGLAEVSSLLNSLPLAQPPENLERRILSQVQLPRPRHWITKSAGWMQGRPIHYGLAAAAGLLMTVAFYEMTPGPHADTDYSSLVGTLARGEGLQGVVELDYLDIEVPGVEGRVSLSGSDDLRLLRFDVKSADKAEFKIDLGNSGLSFGGFAQEAEEGTDNFSYSGSSLTVSNAGPQRFTLILKDVSADGGGTGEIVISLSRQGEALYLGALRL